METTQRVFLVARVSSRHQAESGLGIASQLTAMRRFADAHGLCEAGVFKDEGVGGAVPLHKRPGLLSALSQVREGDLVLFADRSRIGRDPLVVMSIEAEIFKAGGTILTADGLSTTDESPEQVLIRRLIDSVNEFQRGVLKAKTSMALQELKRAGKSTGVPPFGMRVSEEDGKTLEPNPVEQKILSTVIRLRRKNTTWAQTAERLNRFSSTRRGNPWTVSSVYGTFHSKTNKGGCNG